MKLKDDKIRNLRGRGFGVRTIAKMLNSKSDYVKSVLQEPEFAANFHTTARNSFKSRSKKTPLSHLRGRIKLFTKKGDGEPIDVRQVIKRFGVKPKCYLTGAPIRYNKPDSYHLDHIVPISRGGRSTLDNLGLLSPVANQFKRALTPLELIDLCHLIISHTKNSYSSFIDAQVVINK